MTTTETYRIPNSAEKATGWSDSPGLLGSDAPKDCSLGRNLAIWETAVLLGCSGLVALVAPRRTLPQGHFAGGTTCILQGTGNGSYGFVSKLQVFQEFTILGAS